MLCDHQIVTEHLTDYIDGKLSPEIRQAFERAIEQCESCRKVYQHSLSIHHAATQWQNEPVPDWHRTRYITGNKKTTGQWLNWTALAASAAAILMVVFQVRFTTNEQGFQIAFGGSNQQQINQIVEQKLTEFKQQQALLLDARLVDQSTKQDMANKLLMSKILEKTRDERRDDLNFLVTGIQTQRYEDKQKYDKQLSYLADNLIENNQYINQIIQSANFTKGDK
ncbi:zf-HC2 domain-containing protein [Aliikangiella maris]|uniref:Zf-HC2 domain-containing protein n=2 Tax=Aliikangiella maris TaxID=3162458 RepID=A0ABV3MQQ6_9GAMM